MFETGSFLIFGLVMMTVVFFINQFFRKRYVSALAEVAQRHGLSVSSGNSLFGGYPTVRGAVGPAGVVIDHHTTGSGKRRRTNTRMQIRDATALSNGEVRSEGLGATIGKAFAGDDVQIGDPAFDNKVLVRGMEADLRARLGADGRRAVMKAVDAGWLLRNGVWEREANGLVRGVGELDHLITLGLAVVQHTRLEAGKEEALLALARTDPVPGVRRAALHERIGRVPRLTDDELRPFLDQPEVAVVAASAMEQGAQAALVKLLDQPETSTRAALALCEHVLNAEQTARVEAALVQALDDELSIDAAIDGLRRIGTVAAVERLTPFTTGLLPSARKTAGLQAIRAIQARAVGAEAGQVSLADLAGGDLSMAQAATRRQTEG